jgi:hypothetical protein
MGNISLNTSPTRLPQTQVPSAQEQVDIRAVKMARLEMLESRGYSASSMEREERRQLRADLFPVDAKAAPAVPTSTIAAKAPAELRKANGDLPALNKEKADLTAQLNSAKSELDAAKKDASPYSIKNLLTADLQVAKNMSFQKGAKAMHAIHDAQAQRTAGASDKVLQLQAALNKNQAKLASLDGSTVNYLRTADPSFNKLERQRDGIEGLKEKLDAFHAEASKPRTPETLASMNKAAQAYNETVDALLQSPATAGLVSVHDKISNPAAVSALDIGRLEDSRQQMGDKLAASDRSINNSIFSFRSQLSKT